MRKGKSTVPLEWTEDRICSLQGSAAGEESMGELGNEERGFRESFMLPGVDFVRRGS
jgi:hypothetical protein